VSEPAIAVDGVSKRFRLAHNRADFLKEAVGRRERTEFTDFWALKDVSFEVAEGSMFGIIGHNGSGKSTLLRMLSNIYRPTSGTIHTKGRISALLELGTGFHPQLSGRENIYLNASILGIPAKVIERRIEDIIAFADIGEFIDSPVKIYSSGMKVRSGSRSRSTWSPRSCSSTRWWRSVTSASSDAASSTSTSCVAKGSPSSW
jgi:ABC-type polysaccharide/polyol phosphate transport system ATPase subunit